MSRSSKERDEPPILEEKHIISQDTVLCNATENLQETPIGYTESNLIEACSTDTHSNTRKHSLEFTENDPSISNINTNSEDIKTTIESHTFNQEIETSEASFDVIQSEILVSSEHVIETETPQEVITPSAPLLEERPVFVEVASKEECINVIKIKTPCIELEEAITLFGGEIIAEVKAMSEKEEAIVEAGPVCGPEHPLVDLLSTFRCVFCVIQ